MSVIQTKKLTNFNLSFMQVSRLKWLTLGIFIVGLFSLVFASSVKAETSYFRNAYWMCQNTTEVRQGDATTCKSAEEWNKLAETSCVNSCDRVTGKCGLAKYSVSNECNLTKICKETDRANDKMIKGKNTISYSDGTIFTTGEDYCFDKATVVEFTCNGGQWDITYEKCDNGYSCDLGACVASKPTCKDSDGGNVTSVKGILDVFTPTYGFKTVVESCVDSITVDELVCLTGDPTYAYTHKKTECPFGCKEGACLSAPQVVNTKADLGLYGYLSIGQNKKEVKWNETITLTPSDALFISGGQPAFNLYYADKNYGSAKSGVYRNAISFDGVLTSQQTNRQLDVGEKQDIWTQAYLTLGTGVHKLSFKVDADNSVVESSETNNDFVVYVKFEGFSTDSNTSPTTPTTPTVIYDTKAKPTILAPFNNTTLTNYPRTAEVQWTPVKSASKYELEVACDTCGSSMWSSVNTWTANAVYLITPALAGDNQFRAKVRAVYPDGTYSLWSDFVYFKYNTSAYAAPTQSTDTAGRPSTVCPLDFVERDSYLGDCKQRPEKTVCIGYNDAFIWLVNDSIMGWGKDGEKIQISKGYSADYYHVLGTNCVKLVGKGTTSGGQTPQTTTTVVPTTPTPVPTPTTAVRPITSPKKKVGKMLCGNSEGGDGLYSACVNNTIKHNSKMNIKVRTYNNYYVWLTLSNADKKYYRIPIRKSLEIDRADGDMTIKITYTKRSAKYGVFLNVDTTFDASQINLDEDVIEDVPETAPTSPAILPAYDETKSAVVFPVSVNDYPAHKDYTKSKNLSNAFVNVYTVSLADNGTFKVLSYTTEGVGSGTEAKVAVKSGQMVYFEGYKTEAGAKAGATKMMAQSWTTPPYKNFSSVSGKLCQTNYSKVNEFLGGTQDYACATSLSTPYQD